MLAPILFFLLAAVAIVGALGMLLSRNPVHSALSLILNLFCVAGLYLTLNAQFIGVVQVLVYAGAIMVLFLFVIMLLNLEALPRLQDFDVRVGLGFAGGTVLLALLTYVLARSLDALPEAEIGPEAAVSGTAQAVAKDLFTTYALPFEIIGLLLLVATIGAVMIAKKRFV
jgi:NADH-quinone oxidoreductase subunit J